MEQISYGNFNQIKSDIIKDLRNYINNNGYPIKIRDAFKISSGLRDVYTYKKYIGGDIVDWISACGFILSEQEIYDFRNRGRALDISKENVEKDIIKLQLELNRPLTYDDFRGTDRGKIKMASIKRYWGTLNKMKEELGLEVIRESMIARSKTIDEIKDLIKNTCEKVKNTENRTIISCKDFDENPDSLNAASITSILKDNYGISLREYLLRLGFKMQDSGCGVNTIFNDGEKATSRHEYKFSLFLREELKLIYNFDYIRDVKYKTFINNIKDNINCDYKINYNDKTIYVEIAGILNNHTKYYRNNIKVYNSNSRERYRLCLMRKEQLFKDNNLDYLILFPEDLSTENLNNTFNNLK